MELDKTPITITYKNKLSAFRYQVNQKLPPELSSSNNKKTRKKLKLALAAVEEAKDFRAEAEDVKDAVEEADMAEVVEVDLAVAMEEEEITGKVDKMLKWCDAMAYHNWRLNRHMNSLMMNGKVYLSQK